MNPWVASNGGGLVRMPDAVVGTAAAADATRGGRIAEGSLLAVAEAARGNVVNAVVLDVVWRVAPIANCCAGTCAINNTFYSRCAN
jgi:hypothetical protein